MARQLTWWLAGAFVACAIVAVGYLSPSGTAPAAAARSRQPQPTTARLRARGLASQWRAAETIVDRYDIITPSDLKAGHYRFEVGLYNACGVRVRVGDDDKVIFGDVLK